MSLLWGNIIQKLMNSSVKVFPVFMKVPVVSGISSNFSY